MTAFVSPPMSPGGSVLSLGVPLLLGSWWALVPAALVPVMFVARAIDEKRLLMTDRPGDAEDTKRVRWRLLPYVW